MKKITEVFIFIALLFFGISNVNATEYEDGLIRRIAPDGVNATLKMVKPTSAEESFSLLMGVLMKMLNDPNYTISGTCSEPDFTNCTISIGAATFEEGAFNQNYNITVTYDEPADNSVINGYKSNMKEFNPADYTSYYQIEDLSLINYYMTSSKSELWNYGAPGRALKYSKDIVELTNGGNVSFTLFAGMGNQDESLMYESAIGDMSIFYNGYCYGFKQQGLFLKRFIYIPDDTEETANAYIEAAQQRIDGYLGAGSGVTVAYGGLLSSLDPGALDELVDSNGTDGNYYNITVKGKTYKFYIIKGSADQLVAPTYLGNEIATNIGITSSHSSIPLDTSLTVSNVSNDNIKNTLGTDDYKAFDIRLYSEGKESYIEQLNNGKFLVKIPVPAEYEGQELGIYYINSEGEVEIHNVTIEGGFASFETDHFSTYILTPKSNAINIDNPQTGDNIPLYIALGIVSLIGVIGCGLFLNKKKLFN